MYVSLPEQVGGVSFAVGFSCRGGKRCLCDTLVMASLIVCGEVQAVGRLLMFADISRALDGRLAELFWPDDNRWYLVEIQSVDLSQTRAQVCQSPHASARMQSTCMCVFSLHDASDMFVTCAQHISKVNCVCACHADKVHDRRRGGAGFE